MSEWGENKIPTNDVSNHQLIDLRLCREFTAIAQVRVKMYLRSINSYVRYISCSNLVLFKLKVTCQMKRFPNSLDLSNKV